MFSNNLYQQGSKYMAPGSVHFDAHCASRRSPMSFLPLRVLTDFAFMIPSVKKSLFPVFKYFDSLFVGVVIYIEDYRLSLGQCVRSECIARGFRGKKFRSAQGLPLIH